MGQVLNVMSAGVHNELKPAALDNAAIACRVIHHEALKDLIVSNVCKVSSFGKFSAALGKSMFPLQFQLFNAMVQCFQIQNLLKIFFF